MVNKHFESMIDYSIGHASTTSKDQISFEKGYELDQLGMAKNGSIYHTFICISKVQESFVRSNIDWIRFF